MARAVTYNFTNDATGKRIRPCELVQRGTQASEPAELIDPGTGNPYLSAATQYFVEGDMVYLNAGAVTQVLTGDNVPIAGFCLSGGSTDGGTTAITTGTQIRIMPVVTGNVYAMNGIASNTIGTEDTSTNLTDAKTFIGNCYDLCQASITEADATVSRCTVINLAAQTDARILVVGVQREIGDPMDNISTTHSLRLLVKFLPFAMVSGDPTYQGLQFDA